MQRRVRFKLLKSSHRISVASTFKRCSDFGQTRRALSMLAGLGNK